VLGQELPEDSEVFLMIGAANRDPRRFDAAGEFDPYRPDNSPLSFGSGAHYCVGAALARMEAHVAFPTLFARLPTLAPANLPVRKDRVTLRGFAELPVTV
jgi:cytochrome P450